MEVMKKQFVIIQAKRMALGENPQVACRTVESHESKLYLAQHSWVLFFVSPLNRDTQEGICMAA